MFIYIDEPSRHSPLLVP